MNAFDLGITYFDYLLRALRELPIAHDAHAYLVERIASAKGAIKQANRRTSAHQSAGLMRPSVAELILREVVERQYRESVGASIQLNPYGLLSLEAYERQQLAKERGAKLTTLLTLIRE